MDLRHAVLRPLAVAWLLGLATCATAGELNLGDGSPPDDLGTTDESSATDADPDAASDAGAEPDGDNATPPLDAAAPIDNPQPDAAAPIDVPAESPPSCPPPQVTCGGACTDTGSDPANCGACGNRCPAGWTCGGGTCASPCAPPRALCGTACVDTRTDTSNCGFCGHLCPAGATCSGAACAGGLPAGAIGSGCARNADCGAGAACFPDTVGWTGGYCTHGCASDTDCGAGSRCVSNGGAPFCVHACTTGSDCRLPSYYCAPLMPGPGSVCVPACDASPALLCGPSRCNALSHLCIPNCVTRTDCAAGSICNPSTHLCQCTPSTSCGAGATCDPTRGCVCASDALCGPDNVCNTASGQCQPRM